MHTRFSDRPLPGHKPPGQDVDPVPVVPARPPRLHGVAQRYRAGHKGINGSGGAHGG